MQECCGEGGGEGSRGKQTCKSIHVALEDQQLPLGISTGLAALIAD